MADDNSPTGSSGYNAASDPFKDLFGGNPTMGANPTQGPVTSNSAPSSGSSGTSASSDGGGVGSSSASSGADSTDTGASVSSSQSSSTTSSSSPPSNSGISSSAGAGASDTADPMGRDGGGSYADDMSITGGGAPDGRTSYSDPASGGLSDQGPIGGLSGIDGSHQAPVSLSSQATSVPSGVDDFAALRSALGIGMPAPNMTGTNAEYNPFTGGIGNALKDPLSSVPAATWGGLGPAAPDSIVDMGSPYNNPARSIVGSISDSLVEPKIDDRVPATEDFVNPSANYATLQRRSLPPAGTTGTAITADTLAQPRDLEAEALNDIVPSFGGPPVASNIPAAPDFNVLSGLQPSAVTSSVVAQNNLGAPQKPGSDMAMNGQTPDNWPTQTAAEAYDPLDEIKQALGIGAAPPDTFAEIPRPQDPLQAIKEALAVPGANKNLAGGNVMIAGQEWRPLTKNLMTTVPQQDIPVDPRVGLPNAGFPAQANIQPASARPFSIAADDSIPPEYIDRHFPDGLAIPGLVERVPDEQRKSNEVQVTTAAPPMDPGVTDVPELPQPGDPYETASTENAPVPGTSENPIQTNQIEAPSQNDPPPTTTGSILGGIVDALTRGRMGDRARNDYNDYADMSPEQKQAWQDRRDAEQRVADRRDGGGARGEAEQNRKTTTDEQIDELNLQIAELQAELARRRAASQRSAAQYRLIMRNYA